MARIVPVINPLDNVEATMAGSSDKLSAGTNIVPTPTINPNATA